MRSVDWRKLVLLAVFFVAWSLLALRSQCNGTKPRPTEVIPAEQDDRLLPPSRGGRQRCRKRGNDGGGAGGLVHFHQHKPVRPFSQGVPAPWPSRPGHVRIRAPRQCQLC
jgi:hypothetical protein